MKKKKYLALQLKRALKIYPSILIVTLITISSIILISAIIINQNLHSESKEKIKVGLVGDLTGSYLDIGLNTLKNLDSSRFSFEFIEMSEDEAQEKLSGREISGYLKIPENFVYNLAHGNNHLADYFMLNAPESFGIFTTGEVINTVSDFVTNSQNAIQSMINSADRANLKTVSRKNVDKLGLIYLNKILSRTSSYNIKNIGIKDSVSMEAYYICGALMFFLLLWGISCNKLLSKKNFAFSKSLCSVGLKTPTQILCEYISFVITAFLTVVLFSAIFGIVVSINDFGIKELSSANFFTCIGFAFKLLPVIAMICAMQQFLYELVFGTVNSVLLQFLVAISLAYISGCFYPTTFFPEQIQSFAEFLPSGIGLSYMRKTMMSLPVSKEFLFSAIYTAVFILLNIAARKQKLAGDIQ